MPRFIDPTGRPTYGIARCDRCSFKFPLDELYDDPNFPGLKVCQADMDEFDPYRLPPREADEITLPFTRPDEKLITTTVRPGDPGWPPADAVTITGQDTVTGT